MNQKPVFFYAMLILAMITWGVSWASGKVLSSMANPEVLLFWRFFFTFLTLVPAVHFVDKSWKIPRGSLKYVVAGGIFMSGYNYLFFTGLHNGLAGAGGVLVTTMNPVLTFVLASAIQKYKPEKKEIAGLVIGILGGLIMIHAWRLSWNDLVQSGNIFLIGASLTWAFMTLTSQYSGKTISLLKFTMYVHALAAAISFVPASALNWNEVIHFPAIFWGNIIYLSVISTSFGTTVYFSASRALGSKSASSFIFIVPLTALLGGIVFLGEKPGVYILAGGSLSLAAVYLINSTGGQKKTSKV